MRIKNTCLYHHEWSHERELILEFASKMPSNTQTERSQGWCFTWNNYTEDDERWIQSEVKKNAIYVVYGREKGESGTPHLQGYVYFNSRRTRRSASKMLPRAHLQPARGNADQNFKYCTKETLTYEYGKRPQGRNEVTESMNSARKAKAAKALAYAEEGNWDKLREEFPDMWIKNEEKLRAKYKPVIENLDGELEHEWWVGATGVGKSRLAHELYPDHFSKKINKWWCGYAYEEVVVIEEWAPGANPGTVQALKQWADRYRFPAEIKGGNIGRIRPRKIIVLSNYTPHQCFENNSDLEPMLRRFTVLKFPLQEDEARRRAGQDELPDITDLLPTEIEEEELRTTLEKEGERYLEYEAEELNPNDWVWGENLFTP